jgi:Kef-type K+ transport system membrane component KefB
MVGLLLFGVILGRHVLGVFGENRPIANFFAELGKLLLMFSAGLEIDVALFREARTRSIIFGLFTTIAPLLLGTVFGLAFRYSLIPAIVVGSLLASHTLLGLPVSPGSVPPDSNRSSSRSAQRCSRTPCR